MKSTIVNLPVSQTDYITNLPVAVPGQAIRVKQVIALAAGTATNVTFNSKGTGAGTAISPLWPFGSNGGFSSPIVESGLFQTNIGEGLALTSGAGSQVALMIFWDYFPG